MSTTVSSQTSPRDLPWAMLPVMLAISTPAYQFWLVGRIEWNRKITQRPPERAESIAPLKTLAASPPTAALIGRSNGSALSRGAIVPPAAPRLSKNLLRAGAAQPSSPNGAAIVQHVWP